MRIRIAVLVAIVMASGVVPAWAQGDGIKVRGQWTITITNPDGTVASRHEFDNALAVQGQVALVELMARTTRLAAWRVRLGGLTTCPNVLCTLTEDGPASPNYRPVSVSISEENGVPRLKLTTGVRPEGGGTIYEVNTFADLTTPVYQQFSQTSFSNHFFPAGIPVNPGQFVDVVIYISFS
jgi:hypothetical protein